MMTATSKINEKSIIETEALFVFGIEVICRSSNLYIFSLTLQYCSYLDRNDLADCVGLIEVSNCDQITVHLHTENLSENQYDSVQSISIDVFGEECLTLTIDTFSTPIFLSCHEVSCEYLHVCNVEIDVSRGLLFYVLPLLNLIHSVMITHPFLLEIMIKIGWQEREAPVLFIKEELIADMSEDCLTMLKALAEMSIGRGGFIMGNKGSNFGSWSESDITRYYQSNLDGLENGPSLKITPDERPGKNVLLKSKRADIPVFTQILEKIKIFLTK